MELGVCPPGGTYWDILPPVVECLMKAAIICLYFLLPLKSLGGLLKPVLDSMPLS